MTEKKENIIYISKIDAAKRQLEVAIRLFFQKGDIVAIHTLACSAYQILIDLAKKQGIESRFYDEMLTRIKKDRRKEVIDKMREAQNFFKHADNDGDEKRNLEYRPRVIDFIFLDACELYKKITTESSSLISTFDIWFLIRYKELLEGELNKMKIERIILQDINIEKKVEDRTAFFVNFFPLIEENLFRSS